MRADPRKWIRDSLEIIWCRVIAGLSVILLCWTSLGESQGVQGGDRRPPRTGTRYGRSVREVSHPSGLHNSLWELYTRYTETMKQQDAPPEPKRVKVVVTFRGEPPDFALLEGMGVRRDGAFYARSDHIQMAVPIEHLPDLAALPHVVGVDPPQHCHLLAISEGVNLMNAALYHTGGYTGSGIKIAVLDGGFAGYESLLGTDLPASVHTRSFYYNMDLGDLDITGGGSDHGTTCAEIVYDVAPGAAFHLINFGTPDEFEAAVDYAIAQDVDVISCSAGYDALSYHDGKGQVCEQVAKAHDAGIVWAQAAGNYGDKHYAGNFSDADGDSLHEFQGVDETLAIALLEGDNVQIRLTWDDWDDYWGGWWLDDYDLYLGYELPDGEFVEVARSTRDQWWLGLPPYEVIPYEVTVSRTYQVVIKQYGADELARFELFCHGTSLEEYRVPAGSIALPGDSPYAITVGAVDWLTPTILETFSSQGPTNGGLTKPDLVAYDRISTETAAGYPIAGTSFAAPHVAGAAALVLQRIPGWTPSQVQSYLESQAIHLGDPGKNNQFGSGRLYLSSFPPAQVSIAGEVTYYGDGAEPVRDVVLSLEEVGVGIVATDISDALGRYSFQVEAGRSYRVLPSRAGTDASAHQALSLTDAAYILQYKTLKRAVYSDSQIAASEIQVNGSITLTDAAYLLQYKTVRRLVFPAEFWRFVPAGTAFSPLPVADLPVYTYASLDADMVDQDYVAIHTGDTNGSWTAAMGKPVAYEPSGISVRLVGLERSHDGRTASALLNVAPAEGVLGADVEIRYSERALRARDVVATEHTGDYLLVSNLDRPGKVRFAMVNADPLTVDREVAMAQIVFDIEDVSTHPDLQIVDVMLADTDGDIPMQSLEVVNDTRVPLVSSLVQNHPNPFNAETTICFDLPKAGATRLSIYNSVAQKIRVLVDGEYAMGRHMAVWDGRDDAGRDAASGVYLCRLEACNYNAVMKMLLVR